MFKQSKKRILDRNLFKYLNFFTKRNSPKNTTQNYAEMVDRFYLKIKKS